MALAIGHFTFTPHLLQALGLSTRGWLNLLDFLALCLTAFVIFRMTWKQEDADGVGLKPPDEDRR